MDYAKAVTFIDTLWDESIVPTLKEYIPIPNKSPLFDPHWQEHGYMDQAVTLFSEWCINQRIPGAKVEVIQLESRTPVILIDIPGSSDETVLLYGHLDKQPEMKGWDSDLGPWKAVQKGDKLYGRGGADDGYAVFASLTAINALKDQNIPHARCVILIEACEESGSYDLPFYMDALEQKIGSPNLIICLDSGCGNYEQLWMTTSLRGLVGGALHISVLREGIHSGQGSGIVPSCFLVLRQLLERIEDSATSQIILESLQVDIPEKRLDQAKKAASVLQNSVYETLPFKKNVKPVTANPEDLILNRTWRAALSVTGLEGFPELENAGNVTLPEITVKFSMRLPPTCDVEQAAATLKQTLETDTPFNAHVQFDIEDTGSGWNAPAETDWLIAASDLASTTFFGKEAVYMGEGGSIPFMGMLGKKFPSAQFVITGVLGPASNAHGPNEFLHIPTGKKLTACVALILQKHFNRNLL